MSDYVFFEDRFDTPIGPMLLLTDTDQRLCALDWEDKQERMLDLVRRYYRGHAWRVQQSPRRSVARRALLQYFDGDLAAIDELPTSTFGTDFQRQVWRALRAIPRGTVVSYGELARRIGRPGASRAVGLANGSNPISIVVPCHRVIGANATLTGYGGGLERKRWLLAHEGALAGDALQEAGGPRQLTMAIGV